MPPDPRPVASACAAPTARAGRGRRPAPTCSWRQQRRGARCGLGGARAPRLAVPRRRHGRGRHPPHRRERQRPLGQPAGDPRRRLPAGPGVGDRRVARHRGGRAAGARRSAACARARSLELQHTFDVARTEARYLTSIAGKTASLFATAVRIGGIVAELDRHDIDALTEFGSRFGMAFQIVDDVLDVTATDEQLGKPAGHGHPPTGAWSAAGRGLQMRAVIAAGGARCGWRLSPGGWWGGGERPRCPAGRRRA